MTGVAPRDFALLIGITLVWGLNLVVSKLGLASIPPMQFTTLRFVLLAALLWPFLRVVRGRMSAVIVAALLCCAISFMLLFAGLALAKNVSSVAIASQLGVPFTTLLGVALLGEEVHWRRWIGIGLSFAGVLVMGIDPQVFTIWPSLALVIASAFISALGLIAVKRLPEFRPLELQAWFCWISLPPLLGITWALQPPSVQSLLAIPGKAWAAVAFSAIGSSLVGHTGFYYLLQRYSVASVAPLAVLSPIFSVMFGVMLVGDVLTPRIIAGGVLTLLGVLIITLRERRLADTGS
jgi:O-acetylserine/cysteine efflux transporter